MLGVPNVISNLLSIHFLKIIYLNYVKRLNLLIISINVDTLNLIPMAKYPVALTEFVAQSSPFMREINFIIKYIYLKPSHQ